LTNRPNLSSYLTSNKKAFPGRLKPFLFLSELSICSPSRNTSLTSQFLLLFFTYIHIQLPRLGRRIEFVIFIPSLSLHARFLSLTLLFFLISHQLRLLFTFSLLTFSYYRDPPGYFFAFLSLLLSLILIDLHSLNRDRLLFMLSKLSTLVSTSSDIHFHCLSIGTIFTSHEL